MENIISTAEEIEDYGTHEKLSTEEMYDELSAAWDAWEDYKRKWAIKCMFKKKHISSELYDYNWIVRAFCWFKTYFCLVFKKINGSSLDYDNSFCIITFGYQNCPEFDSWDTVMVSPSFFKRWNVSIDSDGT